MHIFFLSGREISAHLAGLLFLHLDRGFAAEGAGSRLVSLAVPWPPGQGRCNGENRVQLRPRWLATKIGSFCCDWAPKLPTSILALADPHKVGSEYNPF